MRPSFVDVLRLERQLGPTVPARAAELWEGARACALAMAPSSPAEAWDELRAFEAYLYDQSIASGLPRTQAMVGGTWSEHSASELGDWMFEVDGDIRQLDRDVLDPERTPPHWGAGDLGNWKQFYMGPAVRVPNSGWNPWLGANSWWWSRYHNTENLWADMGAWEQEFQSRYDSFVKAGGKPTLERPIVGPKNPPSKPIGTEDIRNLAKGAFWLALILGGGYLAVQFFGRREP